MVFIKKLIKSHKKLLKIKINQHVQKYIFDIINIINYNIILKKF